MIVQGEIDVSAPSEQVWRFLFDVEALASCMPGMEGAEQVDDKTYRGTVTARVGPVSASFEVRAVITQIDPNRHITIAIGGKDNKTASTLKGSMALDLAPLSPGESKLSYRADVSIRGRLGQFGDGILRETAGLIIDDFAGRVRSRLEAGVLSQESKDISVTTLAGRLALRRGGSAFQRLLAWLESRLVRRHSPGHRGP
jgi:carbon monoxide dehydrogenase subunit G